MPLAHNSQYARVVPQTGECDYCPCVSKRDAKHNRMELKTMGIIGWIVLGLIAGAIAKAILPGRQGGGWLMTLLLGVVGALIGGWIGSAIFGVGLEEFWSLQTWIVAILGAILVLAIWGFATRGSRNRT